jgi:hypothetical protein
MTLNTMMNWPAMRTGPLRSRNTPVWRTPRRRLENGDIDILSGMSKTTEREEKVPVLGNQDVLTEDRRTGPGG